MSAPTGPFDPGKHPRGWSGRWTNGPGKSSNAHAMKGRPRARPDEMKRLHAVSPTIPTRPRSMEPGGLALKAGFSPSTGD